MVGARTFANKPLTATSLKPILHGCIAPGLKRSFVAEGIKLIPGGADKHF